MCSLHGHTLIACLHDSEVPVLEQKRRLWIPLAKTRLGYINIQTTGIQAFHLPAIVTTTAKEVLPFVDVLVGQTSPTEHSHVKIYTIHEGIHYAKYVSVHTYNQRALYVNSDNIWLPLFVSKTVYVQVPNRHNQLNMQVSIIGYRS